MNRQTALEIAYELDRRALLHESKGDCALTDEELDPVVSVLLQQPASGRCVECGSEMELQHVCEHCGNRRASTGAVGYPDKLLTHVLADLESICKCDGSMCSHCIDLMCQNVIPMLARLKEVIAPADTSKQPVPLEFVCIAKDEMPHVMRYLLTGIDDDDQIAYLHLHLCECCKELAGMMRGAATGAGEGGRRDVDLTCPANRGTADGQWYVCNVPLKRETVIITPGHDGPHNFVPAPATVAEKEAPNCADGTCHKCERCYSAYVEAKMAGELDHAPAPATVAEGPLKENSDAT